MLNAMHSGVGGVRNQLDLVGTQQSTMVTSNLQFYPQQTMFSRAGHPGFPQAVAIAQQSEAIPQAQSQVISFGGQPQTVAPDMVVPQVQQPMNQTFLDRHFSGPTASTTPTDAMQSPDQEVSDNKLELK